MTEQNINKASLYHFLVSLKMFCPFSFSWSGPLLLCVGVLCLRERRLPSVAALTGLTLAAELRPSVCRLQACTRGAPWLGPSGPWARGLSVGAALGLSRSAAWGTLPDRGSNLCPLQWQAGSRPLSHQGSPHFVLDLRFPPIEDIPSKSHTIVKLAGRVSCK